MPAHHVKFLTRRQQLVALGELADDLVRRVPPTLLRCHVVADSSCPNIRATESHNNWTTTRGSPQGANRGFEDRALQIAAFSAAQIWQLSAVVETMDRERQSDLGDRLGIGTGARVLAGSRSMSTVCHLKFESSAQRIDQ